MAYLTDTSIDKATYIAADLIEDVEYEYIFKLNKKKLKGILESNSKQKDDSSYSSWTLYFFFKVQQKEEAFILVKEIKVFMLTKELLVLKQEQ